jgi:hypothetical protein
MELDHRLVESSGGKLIVEKRFPLDGICIEKVAYHNRSQNLILI